MCSLGRIPSGAELVDRWLGQLHDIEAPLELRMRSDRQWEQDPLPALDLFKVEQLQKWANGWSEKPQGFTRENRAQHYSAIFERRFSRRENPNTRPTSP